jgi:hypothetical protein
LSKGERRGIESFLLYVVTPAKAGGQKVLKRLDTGFRRYDDLPNFKRNSKLSFYEFIGIKRIGFQWRLLQLT